jgi:RHS repeat-associated protein
MEYDAAGNITAVADALSDRVTLEYDGVGRLTALLDALARRTSFEYDAMDRVTAITDAAAAKTTFDYDPDGNRTGTTDALGHKWANQYDAKDRMTSRADPLGRVMRMEYDKADQGVKLVSPLGRVTAYAYDSRGQIASITDPLGAVVSFAYDNRGNLTTLTDERGNVTNFVYDELYRPVTTRDPLGQTSLVKYDAVSNVTESIDRLGRRTTYTHDALNRMTKAAYQDAVVTYSYDDAGRMTSVNDTQSGGIQWSYDEADRLLSEATPGSLVQYTYNAASQRTSMTAADRPAVTYGYDAAGRLGTIKQGQETFAYSYDMLSRLAGLQRPNGVRTSRSYDAAGRLERLTHLNGANQFIEEFRYAYNADDEIENIQPVASAQLLPTARQAGSADAANRVTQFDQASYTFDAEGQTTSKTDAQGTTQYDWDSRGRLTSATLPGGQTVGYSYDAMGRRASRTAAGQTTSFLYDGEDVVLDRSGNAVTADYLNGPGIDNKLRQSSASSGTLYFLQDHLGSTASLTNASGGVVESQQYEAFGASAGSTLTRYGYTGRERDPSTGLLFYRARWYDPHQGRFLSEDPSMPDVADLNSYAYVGNNPLSWVDPSGLVKYTPSAGKPVNSTTNTSLECFEKCAGHDVTVTGGWEGGHSPGSAHATGQACDIGNRANPWLDRPTAESCFKQCFDQKRSYGQQEPDHFHFQTRPGKGGAHGFAPGIVPKRRR